MTVSSKYITNYVGIDVSKKTLSIYDEKNGDFKIENSIEAIMAFFKVYDHTTLILYEPTNVYGKTLEMCLNNLGHSHVQIHPSDSHNLIQSLGSKNKNDSMDAKQLTHLAKILTQQIDMGGKSKFIIPNSNQLNQIMHYMSQIRFIKDQIRKYKQQIEIIDNSPYDGWLTKQFIKENINNHTTKIEEITELIECLIRELNVEHKYETLQTIPGVGPAIALDMVVFFATLVGKGLQQKDKKKVVAYSGLNPLEKQSGTSVNGSSISKKGNKNIRSMVYMTGVQWNRRYNKEKYERTTLGKFTQRMRNKFCSGKLKRGRSAVCAVGKKILELGWAIYRSESEYKYI